MSRVGVVFLVMTRAQEKIIRACIAAQVAALEWGDETAGTIGSAIPAMKKCHAELGKAIKELEKE